MHTDEHSEAQSNVHSEVHSHLPEPLPVERFGDPETRRALTDFVVAACICLAAIGYWTWDRSTTEAPPPIPVTAAPSVTPQPAVTPQPLPPPAPVAAPTAAPTPAQSVAQLNDFGTALYNAKNYPAAEALFRKAVAADPNQALSFCNLGAVLTSEGKLDEAITTLHRAIALDPSLKLAQNNLAWALDERNKRK